ncbi:unnamed protein product [marine sediment metagenome]|uniref:Terminase large subunit-like ATPase domain-containing protein n=1 Tax=marine sediment metagenome TaxID=412755 RepID=X1DXI5_9ZZZZ
MIKIAKNVKFRPKSSFLPNTEEEREALKVRQKAGQKKYYENRALLKSIGVKKVVQKSPFAPDYKADIIKYLQDQYFLIETHEPVVLEAWQKTRIFKPLFSLNDEGLRKYSLAVIGLPKKNSKSTMASMVANFFLFQDEPYGEIILTANSKEQSSWIIFDKLKKSIQMNKRQLKEVKIFEDVIEVKRSGSVARVIAPNYKTGSGTNPSLVIWDELWAMELDRERKFWDELTTVPTRKNPLTLVVSYAGFDELSLLYELYKKGLARTDKEMFFIWSHRNLASWVTKKYLAKQRERLRPNTYLRLHECRWTSSESAFVSADQWDACIDNNLRPILPGFKGQLSVGIDIGYSHDSSSVVAVYREADRVILGCHKCWIPTKKNPIDIEETVEKYLKELHKNFNVDSFVYDPYQFHRSGLSLAKEGLKMQEFPQTTDRLVEAGENLYSLIKGRNLVVYEDREIRDHILKAIAKESSRGFRLIKSKQSERIDLAISLAMSAVKAVNLDTLF